MTDFHKYSLQFVGCGIMYTNKTLDLIYSPYKPRINQMDIEISSEEI